MNKIKYVINGIIPEKNSKLKKTEIKSWLTTGSRKSCLKNRHLSKEYLKNNCGDWYYKTYTRILKKVIKHVKILFNRKFIEESKNKGNAIQATK